MESTGLTWTSNVRDLAKKFIMPFEGSEEAKNPALMGSATAAVEVAVSICNLFNALLTSSTYSNRLAIYDLSLLLSGNPFWSKNSGFFTPLLILALNANMDYVKGNSEVLWDKLYYHNRYAWLDILPLIVYALYGYEKMQLVSLDMKKSFEAIIK